MKLPRFTLRKLFPLIALFTVELVSTVSAFPVGIWTYQKLFDEADMVAIVTASAPKATDNTDDFFPDHLQQLESDLEILAVLKGKPKKGPLRLVHFRYRKDAETTIGNGPSFLEMGTEAESVNSEPRKPRYLIFLRLRRDARYEAVTGNDEPTASLMRLLIFPDSDPAIEAGK